LSFIIPIFFLELSTLNILVYFNAILREFGIRDVRHANYRVALVSETIIRFLKSNLAQKSMVSYLEFS